MGGVDFTVETSLPPAAVRAALLDFSPRRPQLWPGISPRLYEAYETGETSALVREGSTLGPLGTFWARERYEWDDSDTIGWTVVESNFCTPGSALQARLVPREDGGTRVEVHWDRTATTPVARVVAWLIRRTKGKPVAASFARGLRAQERLAAEPES